MKLKRKFRLIMSLCCLLAVMLIPTTGNAVGESTYLIPINGNIDNGMVSFVQKSYSEAVTAGAGAVLFEINTYGGVIDAAIQIKDIIMSAQIPTYCYVENKAISAGALIALSGDVLLMNKGTTIGAAEPRVGNEKADEKIVSMWSEQLASVAESKGRNGDIAAAMADTDVVIDGLIEKGKLLTLSDTKALELQMIDGVYTSVDDIIAAYNLPSDVVSVDMGWKDRLGSWLSSPFIASLLLTIGIAGLIIEIFTTSFGIAGTFGIMSFVLFFIGNFLNGNAGVGSILLFLAGVVLISIEIFAVPGFGAPGILGIISVIVSIVFASPNIEYAITALAIACFASVFLIMISFKYGKTRNMWQRFILSQRMDTKEGYVSAPVELINLVGAVGTAITTLRPAGTAIINDKRVDVVTEGGYIEANAKIMVVQVEGLRVVVKAFIEK